MMLSPVINMVYQPLIPSWGQISLRNLAGAAKIYKTVSPRKVRDGYAFTSSKVNRSPPLQAAEIEP